jgi:quercetin dioxygenase-like cupin family protein
MSPTLSGALRWHEQEAKQVTPAITGRSFGGRQLSAARFELAPGAEVPSHAHDSEEFGHILAGSLTVRFDDQELTLHEGDSFLIPGGSTHRATALAEGCTLLESYSPPRDPTTPAPPAGGAA